MSKNHQKIPLFSHPVDRKAWLEFCRPGLFMCLYMCLGFLGFGLLFSGFPTWAEYRERWEWRGATLQQGEGTCVRTVDPVSEKAIPLPQDSDTVKNIFRIDGVERTSRDHGSCVPGKRYSLTYRIGRTGRLKVESGKAL